MSVGISDPSLFKHANICPEIAAKLPCFNTLAEIMGKIRSWVSQLHKRAVGRDLKTAKKKKKKKELFGLATVFHD